MGFTGGTGGLNALQQISNFTFATSVPNVLPTTSAVQMANGSTLALAGINQTVGSLAASDPTTQVTLGGATLTVGNDGTSTTFAGTIGDGGSVPGSVAKIGTGVFTVTGQNTYTGTTTISGGTLGVTSLANGGAASPLGASTASAGNLVLNGGTLQYSGSGAASTNRLFTLGPNGGALDGSGTANGSTDGSVSFTAAGAMAASGSGIRTLTLTGTNTGNNTLSASIANASPGAVAVQKTGAGTWLLTGANTYSGGTTIGGGTLLAANSSGSATGSGPVTVGSTGVLGGGGTVGGPVEVQNLGHLAPSANVTGGLTTLTLGNNLTLDPGSNLDLNLGSPPTSDMIVVKDSLSLPTTGTVTMNVANAGGFAPGQYDFLNYPTGSINVPTDSVTGSFTFNGPSGTAFQYSVTDQTISGGMDELVLNVAGTQLVWSGNAGGNGDWETSGLWSGSTFATGSIVAFGDVAGGPTPLVTIDSTIKPFAVSFTNTGATSYTIGGTGALAGATGMTVSGRGSVTLQGTDGAQFTYTGPTTVTNGSTLILDQSAIQDSAVTVTGSNIGTTAAGGSLGKTLSLGGSSALMSGSDLSVAGQTTVASGQFTVGSSATLNANGGLAVSGAATIAAADNTGTINIGSGQSLNYSSSGADHVPRRHRRAGRPAPQQPVQHADPDGQQHLRRRDHDRRGHAAGRKWRRDRHGQCDQQQQVGLQYFGHLRRPGHRQRHGQRFADRQRHGHAGQRRDAHLQRADHRFLRHAALGQQYDRQQCRDGDQRQHWHDRRHPHRRWRYPRQNAHGGRKQLLGGRQQSQCKRPDHRHRRHVQHRRLPHRLRHADCGGRTDCQQRRHDRRGRRGQFHHQSRRPGLTYNSYLSSQFQGTLEGAGGLLVNGQPYLRQYATLELENPDNTYQGGTTVEGGLLQLDYGGALPAGGMLADNVTPAGEMLQINGSTSGVVLNSTLMSDVSGLGYGGSMGGPAAPAGAAAPAGMSAVPEPGTLLLLAAGAILAGLATWRRRRAK